MDASRAVYIATIVSSVVWHRHLERQVRTNSGYVECCSALPMRMGIRTQLVSVSFARLRSRMSEMAKEFQRLLRVKAWFLLPKNAKLIQLKFLRCLLCVSHAGSESQVPNIGIHVVNVHDALVYAASVAKGRGRNNTGRSCVQCACKKRTDTILQKYCD